MKKRYILVLLLILVFCFAGLYLSRKKVDAPTVPEEEKPQEIKKEETVPEYVDDNPIKMGIYIENGNTLELISDVSYDWSPENVLNLFYAIPSRDEVLEYSSIENLWKEKISEYPNSENYKVGYNVSFEYEDGQKYSYQLLNPDDCFLTFPKIMSFLYDDVNIVPGKRYYHITQDEMYDYTIASSIKLVGDVDSDKITSDITLTAFCFNSEDDFDPDTGLYRGNSSYSVIIRNINK